MKSVLHSAWIPCMLGALAVHALLAGWSGVGAQPASVKAPDVPNFEFRLVSSTVLGDGDADVRFDPRECLDRAGLSVSCGSSEEIVDGLLVRVSHCTWSRTDELDFRDKLIAEIATEGASVAWAGNYFRGAEHESAAELTLGPCGGAWTRSCSFVTGSGEGVSGSAVEHAGGVIEVRTGRDESNRRDYLPVRWGERRYLVEPTRVDEFLGRVLAGSEPRNSIYGQFYLREGDELLAVEGEPEFGALAR